MPGNKKHEPLLAALVRDSERRMADAGGESPPDSSARYSKTGAPRLLALAGVVAGFVLLIVPGVFALRSYRRWQDGSAAEPRAAWSVLALGLGIGVAAAFWQRSTPLAALAGVVVFVVGLSLASP